MFERVKTKKEEAGERETLPATELIVFALNNRMGTFALEFNKSTNHHGGVNSPDGNQMHYLLL